ncbi:sulfatase-like hydrolase/transferase [Gillisia sp. M10.2A]|uniref:Sulfatase-like hydrolase/transferase n=1 Tax=Gillisia lutea TaxID=2909668 RepID=A0ABS9EE67_9FLAO|nr:alkaline phosphatase family protein [Gillisia lutea]MCF4101162.1 sulfatase-like hydrolase/transferase [Gillisia lutea]
MTNHETPNYLTFSQKLRAATTSFAGIAIVWLVLILLFSLLEIGLSGYTHGLPSGFFTLTIWSWFSDILFWWKWLFLLFIIYIPLYILSSVIAKVAFKSFIVFFFIVQIGLINYFNTALVLLGADIFGYSLQEIQQTVGASGGVSLMSVLVFSILIALTVLILKFLPKKLNLSIYTSAILPSISFLIFIFGISPSLRLGSLQSDFANNLVVNKSDHFYQASYNHYFPEIYETDIYADSYIGNYGANNTNTIAFEYVDETNYPFLHKEVTGDVLTPFLNQAETPPNIVIILVEGLGRAFTNEGAYLGNFTPFLDTLSAESLYWKNFLSQGGRTFAVLPSLLGSLPFAQNGFLGMGQEMPQQLSLLNILQKNGYHTSYYYGGDASFDNMALYLKNNNINELNDGGAFPQGYKKLPANNGFTWGYGDKEMYRYYMASRPVNKKPQLSVLLTVASHSPFLIDDAPKYAAKFEERMSVLGFSEEKKDAYRKYQNIYSSILYTDDALKGFFDDYKKRADFNNTIFVITGDHRIPEIPMSTKIDRYHVPLIVYSPLLKRTAEIASISTHFDIAPSLISYLKNNYDIKSPELTTWMGQGLDTTTAFQNLHHAPLMQTKTDMIDFISGEYHLNGDALFKITEGMGEEPLQDEDKKNQLLSEFNKFKIRNSQFIKEKKMIPDSLFTSYTLQK